MIMAIQKGCSTLTRMPTLRGHSRSAATLGLITQLMLSECNLSRFASLKFPFTFILVGTVVALWRWLRNKQEVLMRTPLLRIARHRAMITPVSSVRTRLIHISPNSRTIYRSFEFILEWGPSIRLEFKCCMQIHCFKKTFNLIWINFKKILNSRGQLRF